MILLFSDVWKAQIVKFSYKTAISVETTARYLLQLSDIAYQDPHLEPAGY